MSFSLQYRICRLVWSRERCPTPPIYGQLGEEENVLVIADVFSDILGRPNCADNIHPNAAGYRLMAEGIVLQLKTAGLVPPG